MKFLVLWHVYDRQGNSRHIPDIFIGSTDAIIKCEPEEFIDKRLQEEEEIKKRISESAVNKIGKLERITFAEHEVVLKVHQIVPLP